MSRWKFNCMIASFPFPHWNSRPKDSRFRWNLSTIPPWFPILCRNLEYPISTCLLMLTIIQQPLLRPDNDDDNRRQLRNQFFWLRNKQTHEWKSADTSAISRLRLISLLLPSLCLWVAHEIYKLGARRRAQLKYTQQPQLVLKTIIYYVSVSQAFQEMNLWQSW